MKQHLLKEIGLTKWESQTYIAVLELGSTTTGPLVKKSLIPQSKIYGVLDSLTEKGLVSYIIKGKIKYFQAVNPKRILQLFKEKENQMEKMLMQLEQKQTQDTQSVELFSGMKAIKMMFIGMVESIKEKEEWYGFSKGETVKNPEIEDFYEWWGTQKKIRNINDHLLISLKNKKNFEKSIEKDSLKIVKKITRYSSISFPGDVAIFKNQVVILNWQENPSAILITNANLAQEYKDFFLGLWKLAKH